MSDPFKTWVGGMEVEVPSTIPTIRDALPEPLRTQFNEEINAANVNTIHEVMRRWMLRAVPASEADAIEERLLAEEAEWKEDAA